MSDELLAQHVRTFLSRPTTAARPSALATFVTKSLVFRVYKYLGTLDQSARNELSKQAALARVINDITHGSLPDDASLEYAGMYMYDSACRPAKTHRAKVIAAQAAAKRKSSEANLNAVAALHRELYHCEFGCTTPAAFAFTQQLRQVPTRRPARTDMDIDRDGMILELKAKCAEYEARPEVAKRERERADDAQAVAATARAELAASRAQMQAELQQLQAELAGKLAAAEKAAADKATARAIRAEERAAAAKAKLEREIEVRRQAAADLLKAQGHLGRALEEAGRVEQERQKLESDFEAAVERRVEQETAQLRDDVWAEFEEEFEDAQETLAAAEESGKARKKRERAEQRRATESTNRLERAKAAEHEARALEAQIEELREKLQDAAIRREAAYADSDDEAPRGIEAGRNADGCFTPFDWRTRRLFHGWLARRIPPASAGRSYADSAKHFVPNRKIRQPSLRWIREFRAETTILGEACAALQVLCAKRIISFGFDESTKLGDGVASTNLQIETQDGEILDVVLRGAFVIPGGTAEQVRDAMESKLFAHCRKLLRKWKEVYEQLAVSGPQPAWLSSTRWRAHHE
jgi:hypothetical protein